MPRRAFLAWQIAGGRGHVVTLTTVAAAIKARGFVNTASISHATFKYANEIATNVAELVQSPPTQRRHREEMIGLSSHFGDLLWWHRFDDPEAVRCSIEEWRTLMIASRPTVVIVDWAPSAQLAARSLGLPLVRVGVPVTMPPAEMSVFPPFLPGDNGPYYSEERMRDSINQAIAAYGLPPLPALPAISTVDDDIVATIGLLDRYAAWRRHPRVPPVTGGWREPNGRLHRELFVYLSGRERTHPVALTAIAALDLPVRIVLAGNPEAATNAARWRNAVVEERPLPPDEIAQNAKVIVHAGSHGISCLGLRAGLPQVSLPDHAEQVFNGRQLASTGTGITIERQRWTVPNIQAAIREAWESSAMTERAVSLAEELAPEFEGDPAEMIADRIEAVIR